MSKEFKAQQIFFQQIKDKLPPNTSLPDEIEDALSISTDSAYRRIRGEKELSFSEIQKLTARYGVSADMAFNSTEDNVVQFRYNPLDPVSFTMIDYVTSCRNILKQMGDAGDGQLYYAAKDIPLFHYFYFKEVAAFKMFVWQKTLLAFPDFSEKKFSIAKVDEDLLSIGKKLLTEYNRIPCVELWNEETISSFLRQLLFYAESHLFEKPEEALVIADKLEEYLHHLSSMAAEGMKFIPGTEIQGTGKFAFYNNEVVLCDNTVLGSFSGRVTTYITHNSFNFLATMNENISRRTQEWLGNLIQKSALISGTGEKERNRFIGNMLNSVKKVKEKIKFLAEETNAG